MNSRKRQGLAFILIGGLSIGFAYLSTSLNMLGETTVARSSWDVHFENVQVNEASVYAEEPEIDENETTVSYNVHLDLPGDFYEFTVDAINDGTIDAMIETFTNTEISSRVAQYLSYSVTYSDGGEIGEHDVLEAGTSTTYKIRIEFLKDIDASDLDENGVDLELSFGVEYVQSTNPPSHFVKLVKSNALSDSSINFGAISSDSNGRGLYVMNSTKEDDYPIYYYRGAVTNNNAKFAGFCWKIVRTTETGGTKLIYNGTPNASGECTNTTGNNTQISTMAFNTSINSMAYAGYMYGTVYEYKTKEKSNNYLYANRFDYENNTYILSNTQSVLDGNHHYTCFNEKGNCNEISYIYYADNSNYYYVTLKNGKNIEKAIEEMQTNTTNSSIKGVVDNWFNNTFKTYFTEHNKNYNDYLEDTIWCNDRSINVSGGWNPNGGNTGVYLRYGGFGRVSSGAPSLICPNKNDSFTVNDTVKGNGALTYPVGLITIDEVMLAGGKEADNNSYYLYTNAFIWTMSPDNFWGTLSSTYLIGNSGMEFSAKTDYYLGVRPSISIKKNVKIASGGDGTSAHPYEFVVE